MKKTKGRARKKKYYLILDKTNGYRHGAFPHTPEGLEMAKKYLKKISKNNKELYIVEK